MHSIIEHVSDTVFTNPFVKAQDDNRKLAEGVYHFSTLPGAANSFGGHEFQGTCRGLCPHCYAQNMLYRCRKSWEMRTVWAMSDIDSLVERMLNQIKRQNISKVRFHVSGDFFSQDYIDAIDFVVRSNPGTAFYSYTKNNVSSFVDGIEYKTLDFARIESRANFNLVHSLLPDGEMNYGSMEYLRSIAAKYRAQNLHVCICPKGKHNPSWNGKCGKDCTLCFRENNVLFEEH